MTKHTQALAGNPLGNASIKARSWQHDQTIRWMRLVLLLLFPLAAFQSYGAVYHIPHGGISNHGSPSTSGSIAWYFSTYGSPGNEFYLTSNATYYIGQSLTVPEGTRFDTTVGRSSVLKPLSSLDDKVMVYLSNDSSIYNMELNADRIAKHCIMAHTKTNLRVDNVTAHRTKNNYTSGDPRPHVLYFQNCTTIWIVDCLLRRAGCDPKLNPHAWNGEADLIRAAGSYGLNIRDNNMAYALCAGVQMGQSEQCSVIGNTIQYVAQNNLYNKAFHASDGITAYHNLSILTGGGPYTIRDNIIKHSENHGIHVSGHGIKIETNLILNSRHKGIYLGDHKTPAECSYNITIRWNEVDDQIYLNRYQPSTSSVYGNTGGGGVAYGATCTP